MAALARLAKTDSGKDICRDWRGWTAAERCGAVTILTLASIAFPLGLLILSPALCHAAPRGQRVTCGLYSRMHDDGSDRVASFDCALTRAFRMRTNLSAIDISLVVATEGVGAISRPVKVSRPSSAHATKDLPQPERARQRAVEGRMAPMPGTLLTP
jgi:hypothetical protein